MIGLGSEEKKMFMMSFTIVAEIFLSLNFMRYQE